MVLGQMPFLNLKKHRCATLSYSRMEKTRERIIRVEEEDDDDEEEEEEEQVNRRTDCGCNGFSVFTNMIILEAKRQTVAHSITDFAATNT
jgi:hypothetical protein